MENFKNKTALVADDDIDMIMQYTMQLKKMGFNVISAETQKDAERIIDTTKPDIAILDLMMDSRDTGFILSYKLKKKYPDVPVIIVTAVTADTGMVFGMDADREKTWIKADRYLEKGLRPEQLEMEISQLLSQK
jgi:DNA-binding response OmpR family regulator